MALQVFALNAAATEPATSQPASPWPIAYRHEERADPKLHLHVVTIDLTDPRVRVEAFPCGPDPDEHGPWQMSLDTVRSVATRRGLDVAVNGNFFMARGAITVGRRRVPYFGGNWARAVGWLVSDGQVICGDRADASLVVRANGRVEIGEFAPLPRDVRHAVSGSQQILTSGRVTARGDVRAPRTAAGIDADGARLILLVVDGRLVSHSVGMSEVELAHEMRRLGCTDALNLDGGGSSTLVLRDAPDVPDVPDVPDAPDAPDAPHAPAAPPSAPDAPEPKLMNRPSDGHDLAVPLSIERSVACVLGVRVARERPPASAPAKEERP